MITANNILNTSFLDLLFENRNKAYGAYMLRLHYHRRLLLSLCLVVAFSFAFFMLASQRTATPQGKLLAPGPDVKLAEDKPEKPKPIPEQPRPKPAAAAAIAQVQYVAPRIVEDDLVAPEDTLPTTAALNNQLISKTSMAGQPDDGELQAPLAEKGLGGASLVVSAAEDTTVYYNVSNPAEFPGGHSAWARYLLRYLRYPSQAIEQELEASVTVHFVVNKQGKISEVRAANDPGYGLADEAVRIIAQGPDWMPAEQNGLKVNYRATQVIVFKLSN